MRHAAAVAILSTGAPEGYVARRSLGEDVIPDGPGVIPLYAIPTRSARSPPSRVPLGAPNDAGTWTVTALETPAANSFVYEGETCEA